MDKKTASQMLEILNRHGLFEGLGTGADDRVAVYLHAMAVLPSLTRDVGKFASMLTEPGQWEDLRVVTAQLTDATELARLLDEVQESVGARG